MARSPSTMIRSLLKRQVGMDKHVLEEMSSLLDDRWHRLKGAEVRGADQDWLENVADETHLVGAMFDDLFLVGVYHWLETHLKRVLAWAPGWSLEKASECSSAAKLRKAFSEQSLSLDSLPYANDLLELLRVFVNSCKHNSLRPSDDLLKALGLTAVADGSELRGLLGCPTVRDTLAARLSVIEGEDAAPRIHHAFLDRAAVFLEAVTEQASIRKAPGEAKASG